MPSRNRVRTEPRGEGPHALRMKDLVREAGLPRETIHFYLSEGLLPPARKTGRNTALYEREHLDRIRTIKELQEKHFLPLRAIKAILDERAEPHGFTPEQRQFLAGIRTRMNGRLVPAPGVGVPLREVVERTGVSKQDLADLESSGAIDVERQGRRVLVSKEDAEVIECWVALTRIGITPERGFSPRHVQIFSKALDSIVDQEVGLFAERFTKVSGVDASVIVDQAVPLLNQLIGTIHWKKIRRFFADLESINRDPD